MASVFTIGKTIDSTQANGKMVSSTDKEFTKMSMVLSGLASGKKANVLLG
jgi:hypothetical protein